MHSLRKLFANRVAVRTLCYLTTIYLFWGLVASVMGFFQPHIYETAGGVSNELANWMSCIGWGITVVTTFILSFFIDKFSHTVVYVLGLLFAISAWVIVVTVGVNGMAGLWIFSILWGIQAGISVQIFYALWGSELFPAQFRVVHKVSCISSCVEPLLSRDSSLPISMVSMARVSPLPPTA